MLRIRLSRVGKKKQPAYRMVVTDSRSPRDGAFLKIIGHYNPLTEPVTLVVKEEEAVHWLQKGARPSETAAKLLTRLGVMEKAGKEPFVYKGKEAPPKAKQAPSPAAAAATAEPRKAKAKAKEAPAPAAPAATATAEPPEAEEVAAATPGEAPAEPEAREEPAPTPTADEPQEQPEATE